MFPLLAAANLAAVLGFALVLWIRGTGARSTVARRMLGVYFLFAACRGMMSGKGPGSLGGAYLSECIVSVVRKTQLIWNDHCQHLHASWRRPGRRDEIASTTSHSGDHINRTPKPKR
jgi:hypothetical protein